MFPFDDVIMIMAFIAKVMCFSRAKDQSLIFVQEKSDVDNKTQTKLTACVTYNK